MTVENTNIVDIVAVNKEDNNITMYVTDHLEWGVEDDRHMYLLQEKVNTYLLFYESGEIFNHYPESKSLDVIINITSKYALNPRAQWFYDQMLPVIEGADLSLQIVVK